MVSRTGEEQRLWIRGVGQVPYPTNSVLCRYSISTKSLVPRGVAGTLFLGGSNHHLTLSFSVCIFLFGAERTVARVLVAQASQRMDQSLLN